MLDLLNVRRDGKTQLDIVSAWCRANHILYKDFQVMETLGYLKVIAVPSKGYEITIVDKEKFDRYLDE